MHYYSESLTSVHENPPSVGGCRVPALQLHLRKPASSLVPAGGQKTAQMVRGVRVSVNILHHEAWHVVGAQQQEE